MAQVGGLVGGIGAEGVDAVAVADYKACQYARRVGGMGRDVKVEVEAFFEEGGMKYVAWSN